MKASSVKVTRKKLYKEVWTIPMRQLAAKYGMSDVGLAKVCKRMNIPRPPRGYWRRLETGAKVKKTPLPAPRKDTPLEAELHPGQAVPRKEQSQRNRREPVLLPVVPTNLTEAAPLVEATRERLENGTEDKFGVLVTKAKKILDVRVGRPNLVRSLCLMDALIKSWEAEGMEVKLAKSDESSCMKTVLCRGDESMALSIEEKVEEFDPGPTEQEKLKPKWKWKERTAFRSTGIVAFTMSGKFVGERTRFHRRYRDSQAQRVEQKALRIWEAALEYFEKREIWKKEEAKRRAAQEELRRQRKIEWAKREAKWERQRKEQRRFEELQKVALEWESAERLRKFINACSDHMQAIGFDEGEVSSWTNWAGTVAERMDPLLRGYPHPEGPKDLD